MGSSCCGKIIEVNQGLIVKKKWKPFRQPIRTETPALPSNYISIPNQFRSDEPNSPATGLAGIENIGNTCFINAVLQCLSNTQPLTDYFLAGIYQEDINPQINGDLARAFSEFIRAQWMQQYEVIIPKYLVQLIWAMTEGFEPGEQHDAQEFLGFFLDALHEQLNRNHTAAIMRTVKTEQNEPEERSAAKSWYMDLQRNSSVIVDLFQGQLKSTLQCSECGHKSTTFDRFMHLSIPIPPKKTHLYECLEEFTKEEVLDSTELWECTHCERKVRATKKIDLWKLPPILTVHLKRFKYSDSGVRKLTSHVKCPVKGLDLSRFISSPQRESPLYNLYAKIDHYGCSEAGHYVAFAKNRGTQNWYIFDDEEVVDVYTEELFTRDTYVLFYYKDESEEFYRQSPQLPELWPHVLSKKVTLHTEGDETFTHNSSTAHDSNSLSIDA